MSKLTRVDRLIGAALVAVLVALLAWALVHHSATTHSALAASAHHPAASGHLPPATSTTTSTTRPAPAPTTTGAPLTTSAPPPTTAPPAAAPTAPVGTAMPLSGTVTAVGDSIMLDIQPYLEQDIPGVSVDGLVSRQFETGIGVVQADRAAGTLGRIVVIELGTNGTVTDSEFDAMMQAAAGAQRVVFVNVDVPRSWEAADNAVLAAGVARYPGVAVLADWYSLSVGHPEWFTPDQVHLEPAGAQALAALVTENA
jgi:lysophospholipase L1-like esterase